MMGANELSGADWDLFSPVFRQTIGEVAGGIADELEDVSDIVVISFDKIIADNVRSDRPKSADAIFIGEETVTFVEFKKWSKFGGGGEDGGEAVAGTENTGPREKQRAEKDRKIAEMRESVKMKAAESIHIYRRFLDGPDTAGFRTRFILVINDSAGEIGDIIDRHARPKDDRNMYSQGFLHRYKARDRSGSALFYDEALVSGTVAFRYMMKKAGIVVPPQSR